ncbi:MAG: aldehyde dehydrogenase family protein, partial [Bacteroidales bacterium]
MEERINGTLDKLEIKKINSGICTGTSWFETHGPVIMSEDPSTGREIAAVQSASYDDYDLMIKGAERAFLEWRRCPAPKRAEIVRQIGLKLREYKEDLGRLISIEAGKILQEGMGEVQEMIDICDFALGQARMMNGVMLRSERPDHKMYDQYHPLGIVGIVTS